MGKGRSASNRVQRGGSFNNDADNCRSAYRNRNDPDNRNHNLGFRPAKAPHSLNADVERNVPISAPCT